MSAESGSAEPGKSASHHICFRVDGEVKRVWDLLPKGDKLALTRFFRDAVVSYSSTKSIISLGLKDVAELASILKSGYESCKDALRRCEERCKDIDEVRAEYKNRIAEYERKVSEYEEMIAKLRATVAEKEAEIAKLKTHISSAAPLNKLKMLVCTMIDSDKALAEEMKKYGLAELCK
jgi:uncharacterized coiled-coil protein SlyX